MMGEGECEVWARLSWPELYLYSSKTGRRSAILSTHMGRSHRAAGGHLSELRNHLLGRVTELTEVFRQRWESGSRRVEHGLLKGGKDLGFLCFIWNLSMFVVAGLGERLRSWTPVNEARVPEPSCAHPSVQ